MNRKVLASVVDVVVAGAVAVVVVLHTTTMSNCNLSQHAYYTLCYQGLG